MKRVVDRPVISGPTLLALERFSKLVPVAIQLDVEALNRAGLTERRKVTIKAPRATGEQLLDMLLAKLSIKGKPLAWYIERNKVHITTQMRVLQRNLSTTWRPVGQAHIERPTTRPMLRPGRAGELVFDETPAEEAFEHLKLLGKLNMHVNWPSLEATGIDQDTPVTFRANDISLRQGLNLLTDRLSGTRDKFNRIYWVIDDGVVTIATGRALNRQLRTTVYNAHDLLAVVPNFRAPSLSTSQQENRPSQRSGETFGLDSEDDDEYDDEVANRRQRVRDSLVEIVKSSIGQDMWQPTGKGSIRLFGKKLVVSQTLLGYKLLAEAGRPR